MALYCCRKYATNIYILLLYIIEHWSIIENISRATTPISVYLCSHLFFVGFVLSYIVRDDDEEVHLLTYSLTPSLTYIH